jgi:uncharacterized protein (TIGR02598 family)
MNLKNGFSSIPPLIAKVKPWYAHPLLTRVRVQNGRKLLKKSHLSDGFSLVEVVLSLGIFSFAIITLLGVMPLGLNSLRDSTATTVSSLIVRSIAAEVRQTDFSRLTAASVPGGETQAWFDSEGFVAPDNDVGRQVFSIRTEVTEPGSVDTPSLAALTFPTADHSGTPPNAKIKRVNISIYRGTPRDDGSNRIGSSVLFVGDNGR